MAAMAAGFWLLSLFALTCATLSCCAEHISSKNGLVAVSPDEVTKSTNYVPPYTRHGHQETLNIIDTVLLATVDGRFHAVNRTTGHTIWSMASTPDLRDILPPLVRTDHDLDRDNDDEEPQEVYIVEPQTGDIFILNQDATKLTPLRKLPYSVSQLVELSPFSFNDPSDPNDPPRTFVGKKETSIITLDLTTGTILSTTTHILEKCRKGGHGDVDDYPEADVLEEATPRRVKRIEVQLGRTDYQINVMSQTSLLQTLSFTVYGPNNIDRERQMHWDRMPDDLYVQPGWEGTAYAFQARRETPLWISRFPEPVATVFDVVTSSSNIDVATHPVLLLQPRPRLQDLFPTKYKELTGIEDRTVVGRIGNSLFAMSNVNFPLVNLAQLPEALLSLDPGKDKEQQNALSTATRCRDLFCFLGVRLTKRDDASSRLSRLLDSPEHLHSKAMDKREEDPRGEEEQGRFGGQHTASKVVVYPTHPPLPSRKLLGEPAPSSLGANASVAANLPLPLPPAEATAHNWTLLIPFVGGFIAVWLLLRKFIRISDHVPRRLREGELIQPLQRDNPRAQLLPPPQDGNGTADVESEPKELPVPPAYSVHAEPGQPIASGSRVRIEDLRMLSEKNELVEEVVEEDQVQALSVPPVAPTAAAADEGGEGSEKDDEDDDGVKPGGKRKKPRRKRGKKKNPQQVNSNNNPPADDTADDYVQVARPPAPKMPITSEPSPIANMSLPVPITHSPSSLVVTSNILGWGSHGTIVFEGSLQGRAVAVKRLQQEFVTVASREVAILQESDDHPNVVRYFYQERKENFLYIALELCLASLADIIERSDGFMEIKAAFDPNRALQQVTSGLKHLHSLKIVHRDIKPQNILVSRAQRNGGHRIMISDFGLCKKLELDQTSFLPSTVMGGSVGWRAPEILRGDVKLDEAAVAEGGSGSGNESGSSSNPPTIGISNTEFPPAGTRLTKSVDIFALGCVFYYTLTRGDHPFGDKFVREVNILKGAMSLDGLHGTREEDVEATDLIRRMLAQEPQDRPDTSTCLLHPFFWTPGRRLVFLQDASDRFEIMERDPKDPVLVALEMNAINVVGPDWHRKLDRVFIENLGKYRKYDGRSVQDLLRALRNKKHHYQDLPNHVRQHLGDLPDGFLGYFTQRFPRLFLHVHSTINNFPLRNEPMFWTYFQLQDS